MTTDKTPTELDAFIETHMPAYWQYGATEQDRLRSLVRAASAKWGSPVVAVEPVAWYEYNADLDAWFLAYSHNPKAKTRPLVFGDTTPQPTQAQAGAVPRYRLLVRGQDTIQADDEFLREDGVTWRKDPSRIFVGCMYEGTILLPARRAFDEGRGIKEGGQHAAD